MNKITDQFLYNAASINLFLKERRYEISHIDHELIIWNLCGEKTVMLQKPDILVATFNDQDFVEYATKVLVMGDNVCANFEGDLRELLEEATKSIELTKKSALMDNHNSKNTILVSENHD